ncbi:MAG: HEAT repeat domain-containing protein [Planctomycetes bacterium]|nr:HEAT repeat domain-containing protein [Planctomycetota bacterium]
MRPYRGIAALLAGSMALCAAGLPPEGQPPPTIEELVGRLRDPHPEARARAAAALLSDAREESVSAAARILASGDPADARELLLFLSDRPDPRFAAPLVASSRRPPLAEPAESALDSLGKRAPDEAFTALREGLDNAALEERAAWIAALGHVRSEKAIPPLVALLSSRDAEPAMAALRRLTTLSFAEPREWNYWWDRHRDDSLEEILRDAGRRLREENASLRTAVERETARANELEKTALKDRLRAAREKKDSVAERAILEKEFGNAQPPLRAWAAEEARLALTPADFLPAVFRLLAEDPSVAVRVAAAKSAGAIGREKALDALRACLDDDAPALRVAAVNALAEAGGSAVAADMQRMVGPAQPRAVREAAIAALKSLKPAGFAGAAAALLASELSKPGLDSVAPALIELLGALRDEAGVDVLVAALQKSPDKTIRFRAVKSLGEIGSSRAVAPLIAELDRPPAEQEKDVVAEAVTALGVLGGDAARARLEKALSEFIDHDNPNPKARENAARGLSKTGTLASVEPLLKCAKSDPDSAVRKEAWTAAFALSDGAAARLDALESLLARVGNAEADAPWRVALRLVIAKPGNFPDAAAKAKKHLRPLADDYFALKDWANALKWYGEALAASPDDLSLAARVVACRVKAADMAGALAQGEPLVGKIAPGAAGYAELRLALIEARCARNEQGRALALCPDDGALAVLPAGEGAALSAERTRLQAACKEILAQVAKNFPAFAEKPEASLKGYVDLLKSAPVTEAVAFLVGKAESAEAAEKVAAGRALEAMTGIAIPAEDGDARKKAMDEARAWPDKQTP